MSQLVPQMWSATTRVASRGVESGTVSSPTAAMDCYASFHALPCSLDLRSGPRPPCLPDMLADQRLCIKAPSTELSHSGRRATIAMKKKQGQRRWVVCHGVATTDRRPTLDGTQKGGGGDGRGPPCSGGTASRVSFNASLRGSEISWIYVNRRVRVWSGPSEDKRERASGDKRRTKKRGPDPALHNRRKSIEFSDGS